MPVYIEKSVDFIRCYHSGTIELTNEQGKIEVLSRWTMVVQGQYREVLVDIC